MQQRRRLNPIRHSRRKLPDSLTGGAVDPLPESNSLFVALKLLKLANTNRFKVKYCSKNNQTTYQVVNACASSSLVYGNHLDSISSTCNRKLHTA
jgi:hypothetical protein